MKENHPDIYVDGYKLRKLIKRAQYVMTKTDRIIYGTPLLKDSAEFLKEFVIAYEYREDREKNIQKMFATFEVLKVDLRIIIEDNVLSGSDRENARMSADGYKREIFELISRIDEGITKWRNGTRSAKGKIAAGKETAAVLTK